MKRTFSSIISVLLISLCLQLPAQTSSDITGVYRYLLEESEGMGIVTATHFIWVLTQKDRQPFADEEPTEAEKVSAFEAQNVAAGTWEFTENSGLSSRLGTPTTRNRLGNLLPGSMSRKATSFAIGFWGRTEAEGTCKNPKE